MNKDLKKLSTEAFYEDMKEILSEEQKDSQDELQLHFPN
jgi:hypothetical protein